MESSIMPDLVYPDYSGSDLTSSCHPCETPVIPPAKADFHGQQLDLFCSFLCNGKDERDRLSNTFDLWDSVPRYSVSRLAMDRERKKRGFLDLLEIKFQYRSTPLQVVIQPARVREKTRLRRHFLRNLLGLPSHQKEQKIGDE
ncbi:hypothetical protein ACWJKU_15405 [Methylocaldum sp. MU1018]